MAYYRRMPYRRRRKPNRRRFYRKRYKRPTRYFINKVNRAIDAELKYARVFATTQSMSSDAEFIGNITSNSVIAQGTTASTRVGDRINIANVHFHYTISPDLANATRVQPVPVWLVVIQWFPDSNADPFADLTDVLFLSSGLTTFDPARKGMFKVLFSRRHLIAYDPANPYVQASGKCYIKGSRIRSPITYDGATIRKNHIYIFGYSEQADGVNAPLLNIEGIIRWRDL